MKDPANYKQKLERDGKGLYCKWLDAGRNLTTGEKQLVAICRAALRPKKIVILDEATADIDIVTEQRINEIMK